MWRPILLSASKASVQTSTLILVQYDATPKAPGEPLRTWDGQGQNLWILHEVCGTSMAFATARITTTKRQQQASRTFSGTNDLIRYLSHRVKGSEYHINQS